MLTIHSFRSNYLVSQEHPSPEILRARLDDIVQHRLPAALDGLLEEWERQKPGLWFIRDLDIDLDINAAWDDDLVADRWAEKILVRLAQSMPEEKPGSLYFPDRPAYLARFLVDLAAGRAWGVWYYQSFDGLRSLPTTAAIRTVLEEDPEAGLTALTRLEQNELEEVLAALSVVDARRLLANYGTRAGTGSTSLSLQELFELGWQDWSRPKRSLGEPAEALFHFVWAVAHGPEPMDAAQLIRIAQALTRLACLLGHAGEIVASRLLSALSGGDLATLYTLVGRSDGEALDVLLQAEPEWIWQVGRALRQTVSPALFSSEVVLDAGQPVPAAIRYTPFGGAFLLFPWLAMLPLEQVSQGWPGLEKLPAEAMLRFLTLAASFGRERALQAIKDPLLRDLLLIPPEVSAGQVAAWMKSITPAQRKDFCRQMADWQLESGFIQNRLLAVHRLGRTSQLVLVDVPRGVWRAVTSPARVSGYLDSSQAIVCEDGTLRAMLRAENPGLQVISPDEAVSQESEIPPDELRARLAQFPQEARDLSLPSDLAGSSAFAELVSLLAQNVLRLFAGRLPGFGRSGPGYLFRNFLDFAASLQDEPERRIVRLGRPPLALVLGMAGQNRQSYLIDWLDDRPFELYQQE